MTKITSSPNFNQNPVKKDDALHPSEEIKSDLEFLCLNETIEKKHILGQMAPNQGKCFSQVKTQDTQHSRPTDENDKQAMNEHQSLAENNQAKEDHSGAIDIPNLESNETLISKLDELVQKRQKPCQKAQT